MIRLSSLTDSEINALVALVEKQAWLKADGNGNPQYDVALHDFNLTTEDYEWLKGKVKDEVPNLARRDRP